MPIEVTSATGTRTGVGAATYVETSSEYGTPLAYVDPIQVAGLVPLLPCTDDECRDNPLTGCCDRLLVFGGDDTTSPIGSYENDVSSFLIDVSLYGANSGSTTVAWSLQKCSGVDTWTTSASLNSTTYGYYWALGNNTTNPNYTGIRVNWGKVLLAFGRGIYRIRVTTTTRTLSGCLVSPEFRLLDWNCDDAHGTVKFEAYMTGAVGAYRTKGRTFNMCGFQFLVGEGRVNTGWYDSIRLPGFFGYETVPEYIEQMLEYQNGYQQRVKDEAVQQYTYKSNLIEKQYHDRFKIYGMMADNLFVSDYNVNNSDYNFRQFPIVKASGYEPKYYDNVWNPRQFVEVKFKQGYQGLIKSICC